MKANCILKAFICIWLLNEGGLAKRRAVHLPRTASDSLFVEIAPGKFQSRTVLKIDSSNERIKRESSEKMPSLVLQFAPGFFADPKLQKLYNAITGTRQIYQNNNITKLNIDDSLLYNKFPKLVENEASLDVKRDLNETWRKHCNSKKVDYFFLRLNPNFPSKVLPLRNFSSNCLDRIVDEKWCPTIEPAKCVVTDATIPTTTTCYPSKPHLHKTNIEELLRRHHDGINPCPHSSTMTCIETAPPDLCKSSLPPTLMPKFGKATAVPCINASSRKIPTVTPTTTQAITQVCESGSSLCAHRSMVSKMSTVRRNVGATRAVRSRDSDKYFVLFKRSPSEVIQRKSESPSSRILMFKPVKKE